MKELIKTQSELKKPKSKQNAFGVAIIVMR